MATDATRLPRTVHRGLPIGHDLRALGLGDGLVKLRVASKQAHTCEFRDGVLTTPLADEHFAMFRMTGR